MNLLYTFFFGMRLAENFLWVLIFEFEFNNTAEYLCKKMRQLLWVKVNELHVLIKSQGFFIFSSICIYIYIYIKIFSVIATVGSFKKTLLTIIMRQIWSGKLGLSDMCYRTGRKRNFQFCINTWKLPHLRLVSQKMQLFSSAAMQKKILLHSYFLSYRSICSYFHE